MKKFLEKHEENAIIPSGKLKSKFSGMYTTVMKALQSEVSHTY